MLKPFELTYLVAEPFLPPLLSHVRRRLRVIARSYPHRPHILDVGGRKSHYTIGIPADITVTDLPRETDVQIQCHLGITPEMFAQVYARRSNVRTILFDNMTRSSLPDSTFDCAVAVEVLEHVEEDVQFLREVHRVVKPGGTFLMTTPNGDTLTNVNPDHKRHYTREQLHRLLSAHFENVDVAYAIPGGAWQTLGMKSWSPRRPCQTLLSMAGNLVTSLRSTRQGIRDQAHGTHHLIAVARRLS